MSTNSLRNRFTRLSGGRSFLAATLGGILSVGLVSISGCQPESASTESPTPDETGGSGDHDGHDHETVNAADAGLDVDSLPKIESRPLPASLSEAVSEFVKTRDEVRDGFANDNVEEIHGSLHDVSTMLEGMETLLPSSGLNDADSKAAAAAVEALFDSYMAVDGKLHGQDGKEYADVADDIDAAVETLQSLANKPADK